MSKPRNSKQTLLASGAPAAIAQPAAPAKDIVVKPADAERNALRDITMAAAGYVRAKDSLIAQLRAYADNPSKDQLIRMRDAVKVGYIAARIAGAAGAATAEHVARASLVYAMANATADRPNRFGRRTADEERYVGGANVMWHGLNMKAGTAPDAGTGKGASAGGIASAKKRAARAATKTVGAVDVTSAAPAKAAGSKTGKGLTRDVAPAATAEAARAHVAAVAASLMSFAEGHKALLGAGAMKVIRASHKALMSLPLPTPRK